MEKGGGLSFGHALYMSVVTMTTVGFGDFSPQTQGGRIFSMFWIFVGVLAVGKVRVGVRARV